MQPRGSGNIFVNIATYIVSYIYIDNRNSYIIYFPNIMCTALPEGYGYDTMEQSITGYNVDVHARRARHHIYTLCTYASELAIDT